MNISLEIDRIKLRLDELENLAHKPREFVRCEECKHKVKEKTNASTNSLRNEDNSNRSNAKKSTSSTRRLSSSKLKKQT